MDYVIAPTIPSNTPESDPYKTSIYLPQGIVKHVFIYFPWGCAGLAYVTIYHNERQVWPTNKDGSYRGNATVVEFPESYTLPETSNKLMIVGWNLDDTYNHTPVVKFTVLHEEVPGWAKLVFGRLLGRRGNSG